MASMALVASEDEKQENTEQEKVEKQVEVTDSKQVVVAKAIGNGIVVVAKFTGKAVIETAKFSGRVVKGLFKGAVPIACCIILAGAFVFKDEILGAVQ